MSEAPFRKLLPRREGHDEELVDHYWGTINYIFGLMKSSELKAGLILSFYGILLNLLLAHQDFFSERASGQLFAYVLIGAFFGSIAISIYFSVRCFMPQIEEQYEPNVFFFQDVITKFSSIEDFSKSFYRISQDEELLFDQLGQQVFILSKITAYKFKAVNRALRFLGLSLIFLLIYSAFVVYMMSVTS